MVDLSPLQVAFGALSAVGGVAGLVGGVVAWHARKAVREAKISSAAAKVEPIEQEMRSLRERLREVEQNVAAQPTVAMVHEIQITLAELKGQMLVIGSEVKSTAASAAAAMEAANRLEEYFIEKGVRA